MVPYSVETAITYIKGYFNKYVERRGSTGNVNGMQILPKAGVGTRSMMEQILSTQYVNPPNSHMGWKFQWIFKQIFPNLKPFYLELIQMKIVMQFF